MNNKNIEFNSSCGTHISSVIKDMCSMFQKKENIESVFTEFNGVKIIVNKHNYLDPKGIEEWFLDELDFNQVNYYASEAGLKSLQDSALRVFEAQTKANDYFNKALSSDNQKDFALHLAQMAYYTDHYNVKYHDNIILNKMRMLNCNVNYNFDRQPVDLNDLLSCFFTNVKHMLDDNMPIHPVMAEKFYNKIK